MAKESIETAVRMVGHLLEHNGTTGPFAADGKGESVEVSSPQACRFCMAGAIERVAHTLGFTDTVWGDQSLTPAIRSLFPDYTSRVVLWEGYAGRPTTKAQRLAIARKLQGYGL